MRDLFINTLKSNISLSQCDIALKIVEFDSASAEGQQKMWQEANANKGNASRYHGERSSPGNNKSMNPFDAK